MWRRHFAAGIACGALLLSGAGDVCAQNFPTKTIRIVTSEAGGGLDFASRLIAQGIAGPLGQPVIVQNSTTALYVDIVAKALPDGYTMLLCTSALWLTPFLQASATYNPSRDFSPLSLVAISPNILVVHTSVAANSVKELIDLAKAKPGVLNYASGPAGAPNHLAAELFKSMAGVNIVRVPYKGGGPALNDLMGGQVQVMFANAATVMPHIKSGRLKALGVASPQPTALFPSLPTVASAGLPGYEATSIQGLFVPAHTPAPIINRLNLEIGRVLNNPEVKEKFLRAGVEAMGSTPAQFAATVQGEMNRMGGMIKSAGIRAEH